MASLTYAPLPTLTSLLKAIMPLSKEDEKILASTWGQEHDRYYWLSRSAWSLYLIVKFRAKVTGNNNIIVWFPAYFCNASIAPLRELGVTIRFFPLLSITQADITGCKKMLSSGRPKIIVFAHYFGEQFLAQPLSELALSEGAWLVEDCVHCLKPEKSQGKYGDFVLYSPHKLLPIPDGALLLIRSKGPANITDVMLKKNKFNTLYQSLLNQPKPIVGIAIKWLIKRGLQKLGVRGKKTSINFFDNKTEMDSRWLPHPSMSKIAKKLLSILVYEIDNEVEHRHDLAQAWNSSIKERGLCSDSSNHSAVSFTPYLVSFSFDSHYEAEKQYLLLQEAGVPVSTWPDLPPEIYDNALQHKISIKMRNDRFYLPVHCSINITEIIKRMQCIR